MAKLNKKLIYKFGAPIGVAAAVIAPLATMVSCEGIGGASSGNFGTTWQFNSHRDMQIVYGNANDIEKQGKGIFMAPVAKVSVGAQAQLTRDTMVLSPTRLVKYKNNEIVTGADGNISTVDVNRASIVRFSLIKAIKVTFGDGSTKDYTNDAADQAECANYVRQFGDTPSTVNFEDSINYRTNPNDQNAEFDIVKQIRIKGVKDISYEFRDDLSQHFWSHPLGGKSNVEIKPEDFVQGMRISAFNTKVLYSNSTLGTTAKYNLVAGALNANTALYEKSPFSTISGPISPSFISTANANFGWDTTDLFDFSKSPKDLIKNNAYKFDFTNSISRNINKDTMAEFVLANFIKTPLSGAISAQEVEDARAKYDDKVLQTIKPVLSDSEFNAFKNSNAFKSGYFQRYAISRPDFLMAGQYLLSGFDPKLITFKQNDDFIDQRWNNIKNQKGELATVRSIRYKYIPVGDQANLNIVNEYKAGTSSTAIFTNLSASEKQAALLSPETWGASFAMDYNDDTFVSADTSTQHLIPGSANGDNLDVYFNSNYAKVMWGKTIKQIKEDANSNANGELIRSLFAGNGFVFRKNLEAALNSYTMVEQAFNGKYFGYDTQFVPDGVIPGTDSTSTPGTYIKEFFKEYDQNMVSGNLNNFQSDNLEVAKVFNRILPKVSSSGSLQFDAPVAYRDYVLSAADPRANILGPVIGKQLQIRANIKEALDAAGISANDKVTWEIPYGRGQTSPEQNKVLADTIDYLRTLDPRLNPVAKLDPVKELDDVANMNILVDKPDSKFSMNGTPSDQTRPWVSRLIGHGTGYNVASLNISGKYEFSSPASAVFMPMGFLQTGTLLGLSFYGSPVGQSLIAGTQLMALQPIIDALKSGLDEIKASARANSPFTSSFKSTIDATLGQLNFEDIYKSNFETINENDYVGFKGLENVVNKIKQIHDKTSTSPDNDAILRDVSTLQNTLDGWFSVSARILDAHLKASTLAENVALMSAFNGIQAGNWNPLTTNVKARIVPSISLSKSFIDTASSNLNGTVTLADYKVDVDRNGWNFIETPEMLY